MYQAGAWIGEALTSVDAQTYPVLECIVVDDGSTDDGADVVRAFARTSACEVRLVFQKNSGVSAARNAGLALAAGDLIALLDSDDFWHPSKLATQVRHLEQEGSAACLTGYSIVDSATRRIVGAERTQLSGVCDAKDYIYRSDLAGKAGRDGQATRQVQEAA